MGSAGSSAHAGSPHFPYSPYFPHLLLLLLALSILCLSAAGADEPAVRTRVEGEGHKNQVLRSNLLEARTGKHVLFTYGEKNAAGQEWKTLLHTE